MSELASRFSEKANTEVHLVLTGIKREIHYSIPEKVLVHKPDFPFNNNHRTRDSFRTVRFIRKTVNRIDPDTVLSFGEMWNNMTLLALLGLKYPVYISDRSQPNKDLGVKHNVFRKFLYPKAAGYIAQTKKAAEISKSKNWNTNVRVIGNPIRKVETMDAVEKENIVLFVGRLIPTKHIDHLIRIFAEINNPHWKLMIVGGDAKRMNLSKDLKKLISELGAEDFVLLEGEQKEVDRYYNRSKIFAFTSSSEGFPNVIGEALSAGLPVIAYDCVAGPSDMIVDGENGYLVPLFDRAKFRSMLSKLMNDVRLREELGAKGRIKVNEFDTKVIAAAFYDFINKNSDNESSIKKAEQLS